MCDGRERDFSRMTIDGSEAGLPTDEIDIRSTDLIDAVVRPAHGPWPSATGEIVLEASADLHEWKTIASFTHATAADSSHGQARVAGPLDVAAFAFARWRVTVSEAGVRYATSITGRDRASEI